MIGRLIFQNEQSNVSKTYQVRGHEDFSRPTFQIQVDFFALQKE
jgi:hypothetical protein